MRQGDHLGDYEIVSLLGEGGMGAVYLGRDARLGRHVALKVLPEALTRDAQRVARFEREARAASALNHPNICTIHAFGEAGDGRRFIVMEHVEGETLRTVLGGGRLALATVLDYGVQIAAGVAAAHAQGEHPHAASGRRHRQREPAVRHAHRGLFHVRRQEERRRLEMGGDCAASGASRWSVAGSAS